MIVARRERMKAKVILRVKKRMKEEESLPERMYPQARVALLVKNRMKEERSLPERIYLQARVILVAKKTEKARDRRDQTRLPERRNIRLAIVKMKARKPIMKEEVKDRR